MNRTKTIIIFLLIILALLFLINTVVYKAILLALQISGPSFLIMSILGILGISFIASLFIGMVRYNFLTRIYYTLSMIWMGFFGYLFLASVLYVIEFMFIGDPKRIFAMALFGSIILISLYGIFHGRRLVVKEIDVGIPNIPDVWRKRKAVWISDLHIGQINGKNYVERVIEKINKLSPEIVFIGGDLFDGSAVEEILECIAPLKRLSIPLGMYFITGNHEGYGNSELFLNKISENNIQILDNKKLNIDGLQLLGVDYIKTTKADDFRKTLADLMIDKNMPSILLKHEPRHIDITKEAGVSFQISGHTHQAQQWPLKYFTYLVYGNFDYGLQRLDGTQIYTSSGTGTWGPPLRVGTDSEIVVFN